MDKNKMNDSLRTILKRLHYPIEVMLLCVRWYAAYPLSLRQIEEMMAERGVVVDHATIHRWSIKMMPVLAAVLCRHKRPVGTRWRMDETYIKVNGEWKYLYRAVDVAGHTVDFLLRAQQDHRAIKRVVRPMLGFKSFRCARAIIEGIETMHMIKKGQLDFVKYRSSSVSDKFYSLAF